LAISLFFHDEAGASGHLTKDAKGVKLTRI